MVPPAAGVDGVLAGVLVGVVAGAVGGVVVTLGRAGDVVVTAAALLPPPPLGLGDTEPETDEVISEITVLRRLALCYIIQ